MNAQQIQAAVDAGDAAYAAAIAQGPEAASVAYTEAVQDHLRLVPEVAAEVAFAQPHTDAEDAVLTRWEREAAAMTPAAQALAMDDGEFESFAVEQAELWGDCCDEKRQAWRPL